MEKLKDYSGEWVQDLHICDFDRDFVSRLLDEWNEAYAVGVMQFLDAEEKLPFSDENHIVNRLWLNLMKNLAPRLAKLANIEVRTIHDAFKITQLCVDGITMNTKGKRIQQFIEFNEKLRLELFFAVYVIKFLECFTACQHQYRISYLGHAHGYFIEGRLIGQLDCY